MRIKSTFLLILAAFVFAVSTCAADEMVVKIGHVAPLSGPNAHLGKENENGAKMAIEELNAQNTMIDGRKVKFELITEDDGSDVKQGNAAAVKLVNANVNGVVGHLNSSTSIAAAKIYHDAGIPQISPASTATAYTALGYDSTFRALASDDQLGRILGRYAVQTLRAKTIAVIDDHSTYGQGIADEFVKGAKAEAKIKHVSVNFSRSQLISENVAGINAILKPIKAASPDVIFFGGMDVVAGPLLQQMKSLGINAKLMGGDGICTTELPRLAGNGMADKQVTCAEAGGVVDTQKIAYDNFRVVYKKKYGVDVKIYAPYVYDSVMTLVDAMQKAKSSNPALYLPFLRNIHHQGITGDIAFDGKGNLKDGTLTMFTYKAGKRQEIGILK